MKHKAPLRVVHLVERLDRGGMERVVESLALGALENSWQVQVWTLCGRGSIADSLQNAGVEVLDAGGARPALRPGTILRLARRLRRERIDVIHGHGYFPSALARLAGWIAQVPCRVGHRHTTSEGEKFRHRLLERLIGFTGKTICCSESVRTAALGNAGVAPSRAEMVYNGIDTDRFHPVNPGACAGPVGLVAVSSFQKHKGLNILLDAVARLKQSGFKGKLTLVGAGPQESALRRQVSELGLQNMVEFTGALDDVRPYLLNGNLFVQPSTTREGLGIAALEAMACAMPVVASRLGGLTEVVVHRRTGLLVPPSDSAALASALLAILSDPEWAAAMGKAGRKRVERGFNRARILERIHEFYRRELGLPSSRKVVLFLSSRTTPFGGGQEGLRLISSGLVGSGYEPVVVTPGPGPLNAVLESDRVRTVISSLPPVRSLRIDRVARAALSLRRVARRERAVLVHVDDTRTAIYSLVLPRSISRVWHLRDARPDPLDRWLAGRFDRLVAVSHSAAERFQDFRPSAVVVVRNATSLRPRMVGLDAIRRSLSVSSDETMLLAVGRVEPQKGCEELVRATATLKHQGLAVRTFIAGESIDDYAGFLMDLASETGVHDCFHLLGRREDIGDLMHAADILVHPSWFEAAPRVVLEAMACGLPVVAADVQGTAEVLGRCGRMVPPRDPDSLAEELISLASSPATLQDLAGRARQRSDELFSAEVQQAAIFRLYDQLLDREGASR